MKVVFARRSAVPVVSVRISFDAGFAADPILARGTTSLLLKLMNEGTTSLESSALARAKEALGADINGIAMPDATSFQLNAITPNLAPSLDLLAEYVRHPALSPAVLERVRNQQLTRDQGRTERSLCARLAQALSGDLWPRASLWLWPQRLGRSGSGQAPDPRRPRRVPRALAAAGPRDDLYRRRYYAWVA